MFNPKSVAIKLTYLYLIIAESLLALRCVFNLFNSDLSNSFVRWVYSTSQPLLEPFRSVFSINFDLHNNHVYVVESGAFFALVAYAVVGYLVLVVLDWVPVPKVKLWDGMKLKAQLKKRLE